MPLNTPWRGLLVQRDRRLGDEAVAQCLDVVGRVFQHGLAVRWINEACWSRSRIQRNDAYSANRARIAAWRIGISKAHSTPWAMFGTG
jgi:hypothetical protein